MLDSERHGDLSQVFRAKVQHGIADAIPELHAQALDQLSRDLRSSGGRQRFRRRRGHRWSSEGHWTSQRDLERGRHRNRQPRRRLATLRSTGLALSWSGILVG